MKIQGRHRLLESGTGALEHRWCWPSVDGTRGEDERGVDPLVRGVWGTFCNSR